MAVVLACDGREVWVRAYPLPVFAIALGASCWVGAAQAGEDRAAQLGTPSRLTRGGPPAHQEAEIATKSDPVGR